MSLRMLDAGRIRREPKEMYMDWIAQLPEWLDWCAAGIVGALALSTLASMLEAALDLDAN